MNIYNLLLNLGLLWHIDRRHAWWPLVILAALGVLVFAIYQLTAPAPAAVTVTIAANDLLETRDIESIVFHFRDTNPETVASAEALAGAVERAPSCVAHFQRPSAEPTWVWCSDGAGHGAVDATVAVWATAWQEGQGEHSSGVQVLARAYSWPGLGGNTFTVTTNGAGCGAGALYAIADLWPYGWANVISSFAAYAACGEGVLYSNVGYTGFGGSCMAVCADLRDFGFDNNTESFQVL